MQDNSLPIHLWIFDRKAFREKDEKKNTQKTHTTKKQFCTGGKQERTLNIYRALGCLPGLLQSALYLSSQADAMIAYASKCLQGVKDGTDKWLVQSLGISIAMTASVSNIHLWEFSTSVPKMSFQKSPWSRNGQGMKVDTLLDSECYDIFSLPYFLTCE